jgi:hypothetical protein
MKFVGCGLQSFGVAFSTSPAFRLMSPAVLNPLVIMARQTRGWLIKN